MSTALFTSFPVLHTNRLLLRQMTLADQDALFDLRSIESVTKYTGCAMQSIDDAVRYIEKIDWQTAKRDCIFWVLERKETKEFMGNICLWNFSKDRLSAEIGYELFPAYQGKGFMSEALQAVTDYAFSKLELDFIDAAPHVDNVRSRQLLERNDFILQTDRRKEKTADEKNMEFAVYRLLNGLVEIEDE